MLIFQRFLVSRRQTTTIRKAAGLGGTPPSLSLFFLSGNFCQTRVLGRARAGPWGPVRGHRRPILPWLAAPERAAAGPGSPGRCPCGRERPCLTPTQRQKPGRSPDSAARVETQNEPRGWAGLPGPGGIGRASWRRQARAGQVAEAEGFLTKGDMCTEPRVNGDCAPLMPRGSSECWNCSVLAEPGVQ